MQLQNRMKTHQMSETEIASLFTEAQVGRIATIDSNGFPYIAPVHFVYFNSKIYIHGLIRGQKIDNIKNNPKVCFEVDKMERMLLDDLPCDVNTEYTSIVAFGMATMIEKHGDKIAVLEKFVEKYVPHLAGKTFPENVVKGTGVIEVAITECTGKYYK